MVDPFPSRTRLGSRMRRASLLGCAHAIDREMMRIRVAITEVAAHRIAGLTWHYNAILLPEHDNWTLGPGVPWGFRTARLVDGDLERAGPSGSGRVTRT